MLLAPAISMNFLHFKIIVYFLLFLNIFLHSFNEFLRFAQVLGSWRHFFQHAQFFLHFLDSLLFHFLLGLLSPIHHPIVDSVDELLISITSFAPANKWLIFCVRDWISDPLTIWSKVEIVFSQRSPILVEERPLEFRFSQRVDVFYQIIGLCVVEVRIFHLVTA